MIKINRVDSLKRERKQVRYEDLHRGECFVFFHTSCETPVHIKADDGFIDLSNSKIYGRGVNHWNGTAVIPVDAEINWAYKEVQ